MLWCISIVDCLRFSFFLTELVYSTGENSHLILSILVKHLYHKNVAKQPLKQLNIIHVITRLAQFAKRQASVAIIGALTDLLKHLRKCIQYSSEASDAGSGADKLNADLQTAIENCIYQLSYKVFNMTSPDSAFQICNISLGLQYLWLRLCSRLALLKLAY